MKLTCHVNEVLLLLESWWNGPIRWSTIRGIPKSVSMSWTILYEWWSLSWAVLAMESCFFQSLWVAPHIFLAKRWCFLAGARSSWCPQDVPVPEYAFLCWRTKLFWWHKAYMSCRISPGLGYAGIYTKICELSSICIDVWLIIHWHFTCSRNFSTMVSSTSHFQCG